MLVCFSSFTQSVELLTIIENNTFRIPARWDIKARALIEIICLNRLELAITDAEMQAMNYDGAQNGREPYEIAREFLIEKELIPSDS